MLAIRNVAAATEHTYETVCGTVVALDQQSALVAVDSKSACQRCAAGNGCGAGLLMSGKQRHIKVRVSRGHDLHVGSQIRLSLGTRSLVHAALLAYGIPIFALLGALVLSRIFSQVGNDLEGVGWAAGGLAVGLLLSRRILAKTSVAEQFAPSIECMADTADD